MLRPIEHTDTLWSLIEERAARTPDRSMFMNDEGATSFSEFAVRASEVAAGLLALGIREGARVSWQLPTRLETVVLSAALARLGAVQNPVIPLYREREVSSLLANTQAEWFAILDEWRDYDYLEMAEKIRERANRPLEILRVSRGLRLGDPSTLPPPPTDGDATRWCYSTSGTTSAPKVVLHSDRSLIAGGRGIGAALSPGPDDVGSILFPFAHIGGPDYLVMQLVHGLPAVLVEQFSLPASLPLLNRHHVTISGGSTAHYGMFIEEQRKHPETKILPTLRILNGGGAPMPPEIFRLAGRHLGVPILHGYGMTECPMISNNTATGTAEQRMNSSGPAVRDCEIRIVGERGEPLATGQDGEIEVRGPMLASGYLDAQASRESFRADGFFRTGDRGHLRTDDHLVITGRSKDMIIRKGENISPGEIEDLLMEHPGVRAVAVIGLPDAARGERVCAVIECADGQPPIDLAEIVSFCRNNGLMTQKIPEQLERLETLPRNPTLKILKQELIKQFSD